MLIRNAPVIKSSGRWQPRAGGTVSLTINLSVGHDHGLWASLVSLQGHKIPALTLELSDTIAISPRPAGEGQSLPRTRSGGEGETPAAAAPAIATTQTPVKSTRTSSPPAAGDKDTADNRPCGWHETPNPKGAAPTRRFCTQPEGHYPVTPGGASAHTWGTPPAT